MRVLILEDEPLISMAMTIILEEAGHRVTTAETAEGAEAINRVDPHDLAICDYNLRKGRPDGVDAALAMTRDNPKTRIIFQSGYRDQVSLGRMVAAMPEAILSKPLDEAKLLRAVVGHPLSEVA